VVLFLFLIGLEMRPGKLWALRREIFGLGVAQVLSCGLLLSGVGLAFGWPPAVAVIGAMGFVLSSTAVIMQMLDERGEAAVRPAWQSVLIALAVVAALVAAGRWALSPLFRVVAALGGREVMVAAALLVVLGSALVMQWAGLSMAMGAFLAGVLLSVSTFRHQLEADVEPFRGILLGLFFLSVGMSHDLQVVASEWRRDEERLEQQLVGGISAGRALMRGNLTTPEPAPLTRPQRETQPLNEAAAEAIEGQDKSSS